MRSALREHEALLRAREDEFRRAEQAVAALERSFDQTDSQQVLLRKRLSARLEDALRQFDELRSAHQLRPLVAPLTVNSATIQELRDLLEDLPMLWRHTSVTPEQRKSIVRRLIAAVHTTPHPEVWTLEIEWAGGQLTRLDLPTQRGVRTLLRVLHQEGRTLEEIEEDFKRRGLVIRHGPNAGSPYGARQLKDLLRPRQKKQSGELGSGVDG